MGRQPDLVLPDDLPTLTIDGARFDAMAGWLEGVLGTCHPTNRDSFRRRLDAARRGEGPTLFDEIVEIIRIHGPGGRESGDDVYLER